MAIVIIRGGKYHIQWYDRHTKKTNSMTTGLTVKNAKKDSNYKKALKYAKELQDKINQEYDRLTRLGIKPKNVKDAFEEFLDDNAESHPKTIKDYHRFYNKFTENFDENMPCSIITKHRVEEWIKRIKKLNLSKNTIHGYGKQCYHFLNFLFEKNYIMYFKINKKIKTKPDEPNKITFKIEHIIQILRNLDNKNDNFQTLVYLLFYTGLRPSDLLTVKVQDIDLINRTIYYYSPKTKKHRTVPFHEDLVNILNKRVKMIKEGPIIYYSNIENLGRAVKRYLTKIDLSGFKYTAKTFRKTFITICRNRYDMDASVVKELVGHAHSSVMDRFYNEITVETMRKELRKFKGKNDFVN